MKNIISTFILVIAFIFIWNITPVQAQEPAVTGAAFNMDPLPQGEMTNLNISFANTSGGTIPSGSIELTVSFPSNWYKTDGVTVPTGQGADFFTWVYLEVDTWRGTNNAAIPGFSGGSVVFNVQGINNTNGNTETTNINVQIVANFGVFNDNLGNNNLAPVLEIAPPLTPLPISLVRFDGRLEGDHVILDWETESEENNDFYSIERSIDGIDFIEIGRLTGNGTTSSTNFYTYIDENVNNLPSTVIYYRLRQVDFDGTFTYSDIVSITLKDISLSIFPNPTTGSVFLNPADQVSNVSIFDEGGKMLKSGNADSMLQGNELKLTNLKEGLLLISIVMKNGQVINKKIIVTRKE